MKTLLSLSMAVLGFALIPALPAAEKEKHHSHDHEKRESGPNGGRVVFSVEPHFEFFVMPDRKVKITFLGEDKKAIAPTDQTVSAISGKRSKPTKMEFTREEDFSATESRHPFTIDYRVGAKRDGTLFPTVIHRQDAGATR
mgnify:CR=1 FL=1